MWWREDLLSQALTWDKHFRVCIATETSLALLMTIKVFISMRMLNYVSPSVERDPFRPCSCSPLHFSLQSRVLLGVSLPQYVPFRGQWIQWKQSVAERSTQKVYWRGLLRVTPVSRVANFSK